MKISIELVGFLAESGLPDGYKGGELELPEGSTLGQVLGRLHVSDRSPLLVIVNGRLRPPDHILADGDVVKLVPPIGGGR